MGELALPEEGVTENTEFTNLGCRNEISVAAESQILSVRGVTDPVLLQIREGLQDGSLTHPRVPSCVFREALLKMDATS